MQGSLKYFLTDLTENLYLVFWGGGEVPLEDIQYEYFLFIGQKFSQHGTKLVTEERPRNSFRKLFWGFDYHKNNFSM